MEDDNIQINIEKDDIIESDIGMILITCYYKEDNIFLKAIKNNIENENVKKYIIFNKTSYIFGDHSKLEVINSDSEITYKNIINYVNTHYPNNVICIINPDCFIGENASWENIYTDLYNNKNFLYNLSCIETNIDESRKWKDKIHGSFLYSYKQDCSIFMSPFSDEKLDKYDIIFDCGVISNSKFIKIAKEKSEYIVINLSTKYNIFRINSIEEEENGVPIEDISHALPDFEGIANVSIDMLCSKLNLSNYDRYLIKCELLTKHKNKLIKK
jgi:hypothetical protein